MNLIARFDAISRECDGLVNQLEAERKACTSRSNVTRIAQLEVLLNDRLRQYERLEPGVISVQNADPVAFWNGIVEARMAARFYASR